MADTDPNVVRALHRGITVLFAVARAGSRLSLSEIARRAALSEATTFRILSTLETSRLVQRDQTRGGYTLGVSCVELGTSFSQSVDLVAEARPVMDDLAARFKQTVNLGVLDDGYVLYLHRVAPPSLLGPMVARPGLRVPATCTGIGKAILAHHEPNHWPGHSGEELPAATEFSKATAESLHADLRKTLARGFSIDLQELAEGVHSVAAPIFEPDGSVSAALSVGGIRDALPYPRLLDEVGPAVAKAAAHISSQIGGNSAATNE